jgi:hypothetical protein
MSTKRHERQSRDEEARRVLQIEADDLAKPDEEHSQRQSASNIARLGCALSCRWQDWPCCQIV